MAINKQVVLVEKRDKSFENKLASHLSTFGLNLSAEKLAAAVTSARAGSMSYYRFLNTLLKEEIDLSEVTRIKRWIKSSEAPDEATNFDSLNLERRYVLAEYASSRWKHKTSGMSISGPRAKSAKVAGIITDAFIRQGRKAKWIYYSRLERSINDAIEVDNENVNNQCVMTLLKYFSNIPLLVIDGFYELTRKPHTRGFVASLMYLRNTGTFNTILINSKDLKTWFEKVPLMKAEVDRELMRRVMTDYVYVDSAENL